MLTPALIPLATRWSPQVHFPRTRPARDLRGSRRRGTAPGAPGAAKRATSLVGAYRPGTCLDVKTNATAARNLASNVPAGALVVRQADDSAHRGYPNLPAIHD